MRIALIALHVPTVTNCRGASALPFHLMKFRPQQVQMEVWSYNSNGCNTEQISSSEHELNIKIHLIPSDKKMKWMKSSMMRLVLPRPFQSYMALPGSVVEEVREYLGQMDVVDESVEGREAKAVWIYGEELAHHAKKFDDYRCVVTTPDCEAMYYYRMMSEIGVPTNRSSLIRYGLMYHRYAMMASEFPSNENITYHLVGKADAQFLEKLNPGIDARFIRHPHYDVADSDSDVDFDFNADSNFNFNVDSDSNFDSDIDAGRKIKLLIAGRYDIYMSKAVDEAVTGMVAVADNIRDKMHITFLGKDWDKSAEMLIGAGFSVEKKGYVDDYVAEISSHDIQLTPISVGTGTKGKVLDAFANGLMVIGTERALENIAVESGVSCVEYESGEELGEWLCRLVEHPEMIKTMALAGRDAVIREHGRNKIALEFFDLFVS